MANDTPSTGSQPPEVTQTAEAQPEAPSVTVQPLVEGSPPEQQSSGGQPASNDSVRATYFQSQFDKSQQRIRELEEQLSQYMPESEREQVKSQYAVRTLQEQLIETQLASGYWTTQFPDLKYLSPERLESVVRNAYAAHPDNPGAVRDIIAQTAFGAREIKESVSRDLGPKLAPADTPVQATVTPKPDMERLSQDEVKRQVKKMPLEDLRKLWGKTHERLEP